MNAIIALCHFCEVHGPGAIFCTQTLRETNIQQLDISFNIDRKGCSACNSIGNNVGLVSRDPESNANFVSSQIPIVVRGTPVKGNCLVSNLKKFLPEAMYKLVRVHAETYTSANEFRIINLKQEAIAPHSSSSIMRVDLVDDQNKDTVAVCAWEGELPNKLPSLLQKIVKAIDEELFNDHALDKHLRVLVEEWKNKVVCIRKVSSNQDVAKIKKIMGVQPQDQVLINYWYNHL
ncbi:uncharacterized protein LOC128303316 isoform X3 [Anopheles moucheti]|uniref:uncharacterized protein LOC128303316 isoform X3 n=1 Tax=Anopheles moucheti TaxID=186751 RepID=UPI0022F0C3EC|nr:uncharacterized protein LOC128303316 isoform X3 [Anopheles moucheti]